MSVKDIENIYLLKLRISSTFFIGHSIVAKNSENIDFHPRF